MSKFLLNLLLQFSKALLNSKSDFNSEILLFSFPHFRPSRPAFPHRPWPTGRPSRLAHPGPPASQPLGPHADGVFCEIRFLLDFAHSVCSAFSSPPLTPGPHLSYVSSPPSRPPRTTAPPRPAPPSPCLGIPWAITDPPPITPLLIPFKPERNRALIALNAITAALLRPSPGALPPAPIKAPEHPRRNSHLTALSPPPLLHRSAPPPSPTAAGSPTSSRRRFPAS
jgi:hypothetical protein